MVLYTSINKNNFTENDSALASKVSKDRQAFLDRCKNDNVRILSLYSELLLRYGLMKYYSISENIQIIRAEKGKPVLNNITGIDFNISHTNNMIMCGISDKGKIGVDVEHIRKVNKSVALKVFHKNEISYIEEYGNFDDKRFLEIWTKKEAYTKYLGTGLSFNLTDINTLSDEHIKHIHFWNDNNFFFSVYSDEDTTTPLEISISELESLF